MFDARRGYTLCEVTPTTWQATYRVVDDQFDESSPVATLNEWEIAAGHPQPPRPPDGPAVTATDFECMTA